MAESKDKDRMDQAKAIAVSLSVLKDCIKARTVASQLPGAAGSGLPSDVVPYKRCKLTLLLRAAFDVRSPRRCSTVLLGCCAPLARDVQHALTTLASVSSLRVKRTAAISQTGAIPELDRLDPALWNVEQITSWISGFLTFEFPGVTIDATTLVDGKNGVEFCLLSELEVHFTSKIFITKFIFPSNVLIILKHIFLFNPR